MRPGLAVYAARRSSLGIELRGRRLVLWRSARHGDHVLASTRAPTPRPVLRLEMVDGRLFTFKFLDGGAWRTLGPAGYQPPFWLDAPRVVLRVGGARRDRAAFERFRLAASG